MTTSDDAQRAADEASAEAAKAQAAAVAAQKHADELIAAASAAEAAAQEPVAAPAPSGTRSTIVETIKAGYTFEGSAIEIGVLVDGEAVPDAPVRIPTAMFNRHGLVAGATGTGKTKTLQVLAEQLAIQGVPVFAADIKGDLSGIATAGAMNEKLQKRNELMGQSWTATAIPTDYFALGGIGMGIPVRATVTAFGPLLLSKVLGLNDTQESSLGLVFHYAKNAGLPLIDLTDLRAVLQYLTGDEGKAELKQLGGLSAQTAGVILRELITFSDQGADVFFGEPQISTADFLRVAPDGSGIVSLLEVPGVQDKPALFSTFLMYLLTQLFKDLPEVGDIDKPKLVFFFDEAHLLFRDASKDFLDTIAQTVRLIRSKGVGVFFVTQTPKDVPSEVLAQLGSRIQHQLRAHTPEDAKALKATVSTYPISEYDLGEVLTQLATGEAIVTVMNEKGAPSPVAWTRVRAPQGSMSPTPADQITATVNASPLLAKYGAVVNTSSAAEILAAKVTVDAAATAEQTAKSWERDEAERVAREAEKIAKQNSKTKAAPRKSTKMSPLDRAVGEASRTLAREFIKNIFKKR
ncbi:DUF853 family protein [soil metagenome]